MKWKKPTATDHPPFKQIVIGLQFPNKVALVKLDRIDENGPVFVRSENTTLGGIFQDFVDMFNQSPVNGSRIQTAVKVDMYATIELPEEAKKK